MNGKKWITLYLLGAVILTHSAQAEESYALFMNIKGDGDWTNAENWSAERFPDSTNNVRLSRGAVAKITNAVVIGNLQCGVNQPSSVIIDGGSVTTTSTRDYSSATYNAPQSSLTIQNGGSLTVAKCFLIGFKGAQGGSVTLQEGTLRVSGCYYHNQQYSGDAALNTRTTIHTGGVLDAGALELNAGVLDLAGGMVIIRTDCRGQAQEWIKKGQIIAMSGLDGWRIKIVYDEKTGWTTLTAEEEPIVLGQKSLREPLSKNPMS